MLHLLRLLFGGYRYHGCGDGETAWLKYPFNLRRKPDAEQKQTGEGQTQSRQPRTIRSETNKYPEQKERVIDDLLKKGFCATVSEYFALNAHQKRELQTVSERDIEVSVTSAVLAALRRNGKIKLIQEGHNPPNKSLERSAG